MFRTSLKITVLGIMSLLCFATAAFAQTETIKGKVTDSEGNPLEGVAVIESGTSNGVLTGKDGSFSITPESSKSTICFSCIGLSSIELPSANPSLFSNVILKEENLMIDGTVVIGYGTIKRSTLANSVTTVKSEEFIKGAVTSPLQMLQGKVAGLSVSTSSGDPNDSDPQMMLRGVSTLMSGQSPLIVIDGIVGGSLSNVTQDDVLSIDVLKDGAAAAIYGTQGNNGVILITTKRNSGNEKSILYHGYVSVESISNRIKVFSASDYKNLKELSDGAFTPLDNGYETDWGSYVFRPAVSHYHNLSFNGGKEGSRYYANISYNSR